LTWADLPGRVLEPVELQDQQVRRIHDVTFDGDVLAVEIGRPIEDLLDGRRAEAAGGRRHHQQDRQSLLHRRDLRPEIVRA
jgi:hypothetical protein